MGRGDAAFYLAGVGSAGAATAIAVLVTALSLVVAAVDQVVGDRRSVAALGADPAVHRDVLRRQLTAPALPIALVGCVLGQPAFATSAFRGTGVLAVVARCPWSCWS